MNGFLKTINFNNMKTFRHKKTGEIATYENGLLRSSGFCVEIGVEPSNQYWEEQLPEKWCIKANIEEVGKYFNEQSYNLCYYPTFEKGYLHRFDVRGKDITIKGSYDPSFHNYTIKEGYTEITYEQFQKHVLNKKHEEKEWEIISVITNSWYGISNSEIDIKAFLENVSGTKNWKINSIKRRDGEIFAIGDKVKNPANLTFVISEFYFDCNNNKLLCNGEKTGNGHISIDKISKVKKLFTTEDKVDIYEGDSYWVVNPKYSEKEWKIFYKTAIANNLHSETYLKYFSSKEAATEYMLMNKPLNISIKELCPIIGQCNNLTYIDLDKLTEKLKQIVQSKL